MSFRKVWFATLQYYYYVVDARLVLLLLPVLRVQLYGCQARRRLVGEGTHGVRLLYFVSFR